MFRIKQMAYPTERSTLELFYYRKLMEYHYCAFHYLNHIPILFHVLQYSANNLVVFLIKTSKIEELLNIIIVSGSNVRG